MSPEAGIAVAALVRWLRLEGLALLGSAVIGFGVTGQPWWLFVALLLAPDLGAIGYLVSRRAGAVAHNVAHTTVMPLALLCAGYVQHSTVVLAIALVWLAHIGMDRTMAYGLRYPDDFGRTRLGLHGHQH